MSKNRPTEHLLDLPAPKWPFECLSRMPQNFRPGKLGQNPLKNVIFKGFFCRFFNRKFHVFRGRREMPWHSLTVPCALHAGVIFLYFAANVRKFTLSRRPRLKTRQTYTFCSDSSRLPVKFDKLLNGGFAIEEVRRRGFAHQKAMHKI